MPDTSDSDKNLDSPPQDDGEETNKIESNASEEKRKKRRIKSCDISNPQDFTHVVHVAPRPIIRIDFNDPYIKQFLQQAGVTAVQLENPETFETIALFIHKHGIESIKKEVSLLDTVKIENEILVTTNECHDSNDAPDSSYERRGDLRTEEPKSCKKSSSSESSVILNDENMLITEAETGIEENKLPSPQTKGALPNKFAIWLNSKRKKQKNESAQEISKSGETISTAVKKKKLFVMPSPKSKKAKLDSDETVKTEKNTSILNIFTRKRNSFKNKKNINSDSSDVQKNEDVNQTNSLETIPKELEFSLEKTDLQESNCAIIEQAEEMVTTPIEIMPVLPKVEELELRTVQKLRTDSPSTVSSVSDEVFEAKSRSQSSSASSNSDITVLSDVNHHQSQPLVAQEVLENQQEIYTTEYYDEDYSYLEYKAAAKEIQKMRKSWSCVMAELKERLPDEEHIGISETINQDKDPSEQLENYNTNFSLPSELPDITDDCINSPTCQSTSSLSDDQISENNNTRSFAFPQLKTHKKTSLKKERKREDITSSSSSVSELNNSCSDSEHCSSSSDEKESSSNNIYSSDDGMSSDSNARGHLLSEMRNLSLHSSSSSSLSTTSGETKILYTYEVAEVTRQKSSDQIVTLRNKATCAQVSRGKKSVSVPQDKKISFYSEKRPLSVSSLVLRPINLEGSDVDEKDTNKLRNKNCSRENLQDTDTQISDTQQIGVSGDEPHESMNTVIQVSNLTTKFNKSHKVDEIKIPDSEIAAADMDRYEIEGNKKFKSADFLSTSTILNDKKYLIESSKTLSTTLLASNLSNIAPIEQHITLKEQTISQLPSRSHSTADDETVEFRTRKSDFNSTHERRVSVERNASYHRAIETERSLEAAASRIQKADSVNRRSRIPRPILKSSARHTIDFPLPTHRVTEL